MVDEMLAVRAAVEGLAPDPYFDLDALLFVYGRQLCLCQRGCASYVVGGQLLVQGVRLVSRIVR